MGLVLKWRAQDVPAEIDEHGDLKFECPFCHDDTFIRKVDFVATNNEVRTRGVLLCSHNHCGTPFEIVHSCFVLWETLGGDRWRFYRRWSEPRILHGVWKEYNERRKRPQDR